MYNKINMRCIMQGGPPHANLYVGFVLRNNADNYFHIQLHLTLRHTTALSCTARRSCHFELNVFAKKSFVLTGKSPLLGL